MDSTEPEWQLYRTLLGVMEEGSLSAAARALNLSQPTVGRHIDMLEAALEVNLFTRSPSGLLPTEAALAIQPFAERMHATAQALRRAASGGTKTTRGTVRISVAEIVGLEILPPILATIHANHPAIALELSLSDKSEDLLQHRADIAIRMFKPTQEALVARRLGAIEVGLHGHPDYLRQHPAPTRLDQLSQHSLIGFDREFAYIRQMLGDRLPIHRGMFALRTDSNAAQLAAIRAGFGLGFCQVGLAAREPRLQRVLPNLAVSLDTWLVMHGDMRQSLACRAVFDSLADGLVGYIRQAAR